MSFFNWHYSELSVFRCISRNTSKCDSGTENEMINKIRLKQIISESRRQVEMLLSMQLKMWMKLSIPDHVIDRSKNNLGIQIRDICVELSIRLHTHAVSSLKFNCRPAISKHSTLSAFNDWGGSISNCLLSHRFSPSITLNCKGSSF